ncbi:MAG: hypothetical protein ABI743_08970, partial [bacterium]
LAQWGSYWSWLGFVIVGGLIAVLGALCLYVGLLVTVPVVLFATGLIYRCQYPRPQFPASEVG